jgi:RHS repeat-associated protein
VKVKNDSGTTIATYTYGVSNKRLITQDGNESSTNRTYYAWGAGAVIAEYIDNSGSFTWIKNYIYMGSGLLATQEASGGSERVSFQHPDRLGSRLVTNAHDATYYEQVSLPFGTALEAESTGATNRRFTSYDRSANTGLDYAVNRFYDSGQGRFTQVDPIGMGDVRLRNPQSLNLYSYCHNDPINNTDPDGLGLISWFKKGLKKIGNWFKKHWKAVLIAAVVAAAIIFIPPLSKAVGSFMHSVFKLGHMIYPKIASVAPAYAESTVSMLPRIIGAVGTGIGTGAVVGAAQGGSSEPEYQWNENNALERVDGQPILSEHATIVGELEPIKVPKLSFWKCFEKNKFSSLFAGTKLQTAAEFVEIGSEISLGGDIVATIYKSTQKTIGKPQPYASGLNWALRRFANTVGSSSLKGSLVRVGSKVTPILAGVGAFTAGYNLSTAVQCGLGVL